MKQYTKKASILLILFLLFGVSLTLTYPIISATSKIFVGGTGQGNYTTITEALHHANPGSEIFIHTGLYNETLDITKPVSLIGENQNGTILDGCLKDSVIRLTADHIQISNLTIQHGKDMFPEAGIAIYSQYNHIANTTLKDNYYGIVMIFPAGYNTIVDNSIADNHQCGIYFSETVHNHLARNTVDNQPFNGFGLYDYSNNNVIIDNLLSHNDGHGINIRDSYTNIVQDNMFLENTKGIHIPPPQFHTTLINNTFIGNKLAIDEEPMPLFVTLPEYIVLVFLGLLVLRKFFF
ncbi:MAG: right-handed parallel beta-helix repeat-containing protein [Candidatus Thermoplasmatota archaeon]|nr:right-handed parallel beta-helix repeat-containing protein [Candidatus Thermoplasmatota archaeon]MBU1941565.1 right-handed parallel beta-helix repeat-containing protein [Candidatus Thermoplasmatota archaeon]